jgi:hypothetical protein
MKTEELELDEEMDYLDRQLDQLPGRAGLEMVPPAASKPLVSIDEQTAEWTFPRFSRDIYAWLLYIPYTLAGVAITGTFDSYLDRLIGLSDYTGRKRTDVYISNAGLGQAAQALLERNFQGLENIALDVVEDATPVAATPLRSHFILTGRFHPGPWYWKLATRKLATGFPGSTAVTSMNPYMVPILWGEKADRQLAAARPGTQQPRQVAPAGGYTRVVSEVRPSNTEFQVPWDPGLGGNPIKGARHVKISSIANLSQLSINDTPLDATAQDAYRRFSQAFIDNTQKWNAALANPQSFAFVKPTKVGFTLTAAATPTISFAADE